jgi:ABC-type polysaccharide/polyol phosphate export permease
MLVSLYWFVFTFMIPARAGGDGSRYIHFLIAGLIPWLAISEGLMRSTTSIVDNGPMVRRLSFRSELLVIVPNASALIFECIAFAIFLTWLMVKQGFPRNVWILPFALALQFALQIGIAMFLAAAYVFFRDLAQLVGFGLSIVFYLSPILYAVPARFERFFLWNPLTPLVGLFRSAVLSAALPEVRSIVFLLAACTAIFAAGLFFFRRAESDLIDLI